MLPRRICVVLLLAAASAAGLQARDEDDDDGDYPPIPGGLSWEGDPFPTGYGHSDNKHPYVRSLMPDPELFPRKDEGGIQTRFRLGRDLFVNVGPNGSFDRETALLRVLEEDWDADHRIAAIEDLTLHYKNLRTARTITRRLGDINLRVREAAVDALGQLGYRGAIVPLIGVLRVSINDSLKSAISFALGKITGRDYGTDPEAWEAWHASARKTLYQQGTILPLKKEARFPEPAPVDPVMAPVEAEIDEDDDEELP